MKARSGAPRVAPARVVAFEILLKMESSASAHSDTLLRSAAVERLVVADRNLATALVMGVLRWQLALDAAIAPLLARRAKLDIPVAVALRLGAFQLLAMDRIPAHAAIHDSVELVKQAGQRFASGMVNAVLRRVAKGEAAGALAAQAAHPAWLRERWRSTYGAAEAEAICAYDQEPPPVAVRVADAERQRELQAAGALLEPGAFLTRARAVRRVRGEAAAWLEDGVRLQDEGSQLVAELAGRGQRILDCCAAPGGKTAILAERSPHAEILACDISPVRLREMRAHFAEDPTTARIETREVDARALSFAGEFDAILCDAPCSGTGTLARNPETKLRLTRDELPRQAERQIAILTEALRHLAPGGRLVYSTCSLEPEENEAVVRAVLRERVDVRVIPMEQRLADLESEGALHAEGARRLRDAGVRDGFLRTLPGVLPCDGFFAAVLTR